MYVIILKNKCVGPFPHEASAIQFAKECYPNSHWHVVEMEEPS